MNWVGGAAFFVLLLNWLRPGLLPIWLVGIALVVLIATFFYRMISGFWPSKIVVDEQGALIRTPHFRTQIAWQEIARIEASKYPSGRANTFCVELHRDGHAHDEVSIFDSYRGFAEFEAEIFKRWPQIVDGWKRVFTGPLTEAQFTTLWRRGDL